MERRCACRFRQVCRCFFMDLLFLDQKKSYLYCHTFVSLSLHVCVTIVIHWCNCRHTNVSRFKVIYVLLICNNNPNIIYYANKV